MTHDEALWAAKLHLSTGTPGTALSDEAVRAVCRALVEADRSLTDTTRALHEKCDTCEVGLNALANPEAVRVNILRGVIAIPPDLVWLGDSDGPVARRVAEAVAEEREACAALFEPGPRGHEFTVVSWQVRHFIRNREVIRHHTATCVARPAPELAGRINEDES